MEWWSSWLWNEKRFCFRKWNWWHAAISILISYSSNRKLVNCFHLSKKSWKLIHISGNHCSFNLKAVIPTIILSSKNMFSCHEFSWRCFVSIQCLIPLSTVNKSCWVLEDVLTAHLLLTAGKKWALTKAYKFMLKAEKFFWTLPILRKQKGVMHLTMKNHLNIYGNHLYKSVIKMSYTYSNVRVKPWYGPKWFMGPVLNYGFLSMKRLRVLPLPLYRMLVHCRVTPSTFAGTYLNTWVKRSTVKIKPGWAWSGLEPWPPDLESSELTMRPLRLLVIYSNVALPFIRISNSNILKIC